MYEEVASRTGLIVDASNNPYNETSRAVEVSGQNAAQFDVLVYNFSSAGALYVALQGSNDLENWVIYDSDLLSVSAVGYHRSNLITDIGFQYVRLKYSFGTAVGDYCVYAAGVSTLEL